MLQPKYFTHLFAGQTRAAFRNGFFRQITVFEVFNISLNQLAGKVALRPSRALGKLGQSALNTGFSGTESMM